MPLAGMSPPLAAAMQVEDQWVGALGVVILRDKDGILVVVFLDGAVLVRVVVKLARGVVGRCCKAGKERETADEQASGQKSEMVTQGSILSRFQNREAGLAATAIRLRARLFFKIGRILPSYS